TAARLAAAPALMATVAASARASANRVARRFARTQSGRGVAASDAGTRGRGRDILTSLSIQLRGRQMRRRVPQGRSAYPAAAGRASLSPLCTASQVPCDFARAVSRAQMRTRDFSRWATDDVLALKQAANAVTGPRGRAYTPGSSLRRRLGALPVAWPTPS